MSDLGLQGFSGLRDLVHVGFGASGFSGVGFQGLWQGLGVRASEYQDLGMRSRGDELLPGRGRYVTLASFNALGYLGVQDLERRHSQVKLLPAAMK